MNNKALKKEIKYKVYKLHCIVREFTIVNESIDDSLDDSRKLILLAGLARCEKEYYSIKLELNQLLKTYSILQNSNKLPIDFEIKKLEKELR